MIPLIIALMAIAIATILPLSRRHSQDRLWWDDGVWERCAKSKGSEAVAHTYIVNLDRCQDRYRHVEAMAAKANWSVERFRATSHKEIDLTSPPIPIRRVRCSETIKAGQVACTVSHRRLWKDALDRRFDVVAVFEDDVFMTTRLARFLNAIVDEVNRESDRRNLSWHYLFLRRLLVDQNSREEVWSPNVTRAAPSWGTAAYIVTKPGMKFLLDAVDHFSRPLDLQIAELLAQDSNFIALSLCHEDQGKLCHANVEELTMDEKGFCHGSSTQRGWEREGQSFHSCI